MENSDIKTFGVNNLHKHTKYLIIFSFIACLITAATISYQLGKKNAIYEINKPAPKIAVTIPTLSATATGVQTPTPTQISVISPTITTKYSPTPYKLPPNWNTSIVDLWGPGEGSEGKYWKVKISLPPKLEYVSNGSEEFVRPTDDYNIYWDFHLEKAVGSRREQYKNYLVRAGGYIEGNKPSRTCSITKSKEILIDETRSYLDVTGSCESKNTDGSTYNYNEGAYLYQTQGMLFIIVKPINTKTTLFEQNLTKILTSLKVQ